MAFKSKVRMAEKFTRSRFERGDQKLRLQKVAKMCFGQAQYDCQGGLHVSF